MAIVGELCPVFAYRIPADCKPFTDVEDLLEGFDSLILECLFGSERHSVKKHKRVFSENQYVFRSDLTIVAVIENLVAALTSLRNEFSQLLREINLLPTTGLSEVLIYIQN